jgi:hypothetical protein
MRSTKKPKQDVGSYWLKHVIEYGDNYVLNGAVVDAALLLVLMSFPVVKISPNAGFRFMFAPEPSPALWSSCCTEKAQNRFNKAKYYCKI